MNAGLQTPLGFRTDSASLRSDSSAERPFQRPPHASSQPTVGQLVADEALRGIAERWR